MAAWDSAQLPNAPQALSYGAPQIDLSGFVNAPNAFFQGAQNRQQYDLARTFQEGLPKDPQGNIDFKAAAEMLAKRGALDQIVPLANLDIQRQGQLIGQQAGANLGAGVIPGGMTPVPGGVPTSVAPSSPAGPAPVPASVAGPVARPVTSPGQGDQPGSVMDVVSQAVPPEKAGFVATRIAAKLGIDPNVPMTPAQNAQLTEALRGGGYSVAPAGAPSGTAGAKAAPVTMAAPGIPATPGAAESPPVSAGQPGPISDPTLGGLVPPMAIKLWGPEQAAGRYADFLYGEAARIKSTPGAQGAEALLKKAEAVSTALQKASEPTGPMKEFAANKLPGETFAQYTSRIKEAEKSGEVRALNEELPADMRGYNQARRMGFQGSFEDWRQRSDVDRTQLAILEKSVLPRLDKSWDSANAAREGITAIHRSREQLDASGGIISGATAEGRLKIAKVLNVAGLGNFEDKVANTEAFRSAVGSQVLATIKGLPGPASDKDVALGKGIAGGDIALDEKSLKRILDLSERAAREKITSHEKLVRQSVATNPILKQSAGAYTVEAPGRYGEAPAPQPAPAPTPGTAQAAPTAAPDTSAPVAVNSPEDYAQLPSGRRYIAPDGSTRTKQ